MTDRPTISPKSRLSSNGVGGSTLPATAAFPASGKPKKRKAIPVKVQVTIAFLQATFGGKGVLCPLCVEPIDFAEPRVLEHMIPHATLVALGKDPDNPENLRWVHAECAKKKTNGNAATCADGDTHKVAKSKRLATARAVHDAVKRGEHVRPASRIKNAGFRQWRKFNGEKVSK